VQHDNNPNSALSGLAEPPPDHSVFFVTIPAIEPGARKTGSLLFAKMPIQVMGNESGASGVSPLSLEDVLATGRG
jgi:hypothetical protein